MLTIMKNWCFWIVMLERLLCPLDSKEIKPVNSKRNHPWIFTERTVAETEAATLWPPAMKSRLSGKDPDAGRDGGRRKRGRQRMRWLNGITDSMDVEFEWTPGVGDGQGGLTCCRSWGRRESDTTERLSWTDLSVCMSILTSHRIPPLLLSTW